MSQRPHVTIIGAGIVGVCAGLHLQRAGMQVTVVDRLPPGEATSLGNACIITDSSMVPIPGPGIVKSGLKMLINPRAPLFVRGNYALKVAPWLIKFAAHGKLDKVRHSAAALADLLRDSLAEHHELADNTPASQWLRDQPTLYVYSSEQAQQREQLGWQLRKEHSVAFERVESDELRALEPALDRRFQFAIRTPNHGQALNPSKLTKAHAQWLERSGGEVLQREVRGIETDANGAKRLLTDHDPLPLDKLLIAAGPWSAKLALELAEIVPLESEGGYHLTLTDPGVTLNHPLMITAAKLAMSPMELGIRVGGMVEFAGLDPDPHPQRWSLIADNVKTILPEANISARTEWRGNRPSLPDSLPVISRSARHSNVYYAFGNQHVGLSSGPKTGKLIAQLIAGQTPSLDLTPFRIDRF